MQITALAAAVLTVGVAAQPRVEVPVAAAAAVNVAAATPFVGGRRVVGGNIYGARAGRVVGGLPYGIGARGVVGGMPMGFNAGPYGAARFNGVPAAVNPGFNFAAPRVAAPVGFNFAAPAPVAPAGFEFPAGFDVEKALADAIAAMSAPAPAPEPVAAPAPAPPAPVFNRPGDWIDWNDSYRNSVASYNAAESKNPIYHGFPLFTLRDPEVDPIDGFSVTSENSESRPHASVNSNLQDNLKTYATIIGVNAKNVKIELMLDQLDRARAAGFPEDHPDLRILKNEIAAKEYERIVQSATMLNNNGNLGTFAGMASWNSADSDRRNAEISLRQAEMTGNQDLIARAVDNYYGNEAAATAAGLRWILDMQQSKQGLSADDGTANPVSDTDRNQQFTNMASLLDIQSKSYSVKMAEDDLIAAEDMYEMFPNGANQIELQQAQYNYDAANADYTVENLNLMAHFGAVSPSVSAPFLMLMDFNAQDLKYKAADLAQSARSDIYEAVYGSKPYDEDHYYR